MDMCDNMCGINKIGKFFAMEFKNLSFINVEGIALLVAHKEQGRAILATYMAGSFLFSRTSFSRARPEDQGTTRPTHIKKSDGIGPEPKTTVCLLRTAPSFPLSSWCSF